MLYSSFYTIHKVQRYDTAYLNGDQPLLSCPCWTDNRQVKVPSTVNKYKNCNVSIEHVATKPMVGTWSHWQAGHGQSALYIHLVWGRDSCKWAMPRLEKGRTGWRGPSARAQVLYQDPAAVLRWCLWPGQQGESGDMSLDSEATRPSASQSKQGVWPWAISCLLFVWIQFCVS